MGDESNGSLEKINHIYGLTLFGRIVTGFGIQR